MMMADEGSVRAPHAAVTSLLALLIDDEYSCSGARGPFGL